MRRNTFEVGGKRMRNIRCIDCKALDVGFNPDTDMWIHCGIRHAEDIAKAAQEGATVHAQERITKEKALMVHDCPYFDEAEQKQTYEELLENEKTIQENPRLVKERVKFQKELIRHLQKKSSGVSVRKV